MTPARGRYEEFGAPPWMALLLALLLAVAVGPSLAHLHTQAPVHHATTQVVRSNIP